MSFSAYFAYSAVNALSPVSRPFACIRGGFFFEFPPFFAVKSSRMFAQEKAWLEAVDCKKKIESSPLLFWINRRIRIPLSVSAQRDRFFLRYIPRGKPDQEILDIGCGSGRQYLAELGKVTGID